MNTASTHRSTTRRTLFAVLACAALGLVATAQFARAGDDAKAPATRFGTYDSRALALAYGRSSFLKKDMEALHAEHAKAKAANDKAAIEKLERQGASRQVRLHLQVFSNAPAPEALDAIRAELPKVAQQSKVVAIVNVAEYHDATIEVVDITDDLVKLFHPSAETLKIIAETRKQQPLPIEEVAKMPANK